MVGLPVSALPAIDDFWLCILQRLPDNPVPPRTTMSLFVVLLAILAPLVKFVLRFCGRQCKNSLSVNIVHVMDEYAMSYPVNNVQFIRLDKLFFCLVLIFK
jgi:hypothetical protein